MPNPAGNPAGQKPARRIGSASRKSGQSQNAGQAGNGQQGNDSGKPQDGEQTG